ncbi:MAG TPA: LysR family transcriptional regulator [Longimicrobium sp.]|jgi:DNA-binding transcriptional LysR family regulator
MDATRVDLHLLRLFVVVAEELHFGRAARRLRIAQPALSQQVRKLETLLGYRLFDRTSRRVALSGAGAALLESAQRIFAELERGVETAGAVAQGRAGVLEVGYIVPAMLGLLPDLIRRFRAETPGVTLRLHEMSSAAQVEALGAGRLDVAFVSGPCGDPALRQHLAWREPAVAVLPVDHPLAGQAEIALEDLAAEEFVSFPRHQAPSLYDRWLLACLNAGFSPRVVQEAQSWHMIATLVGAGLGVAVAPESVRLLNVLGVRCIPISTSGLEFEVSLCTRADGLTPAIAKFVDTAVAEASARGLTG